METFFKPTWAGVQTPWLSLLVLVSFGETDCYYAGVPPIWLKATCHEVLARGGGSIRHRGSIRQMSYRRVYMVSQPLVVGGFPSLA